MSVQRETEYVLRWDELDEKTATNLYLYGTLETPAALYDRIYPADYEGGAFGGPRVLVDAVSYMADGPGRYATPFLAPAVEDFLVNLSGMPIEPGEYSQSYIQNLYGYDPLKENGDPSYNGFKFMLSQYELQPGTADYDQRTYVYNTGGFVIIDNPDLKFVVGPNNERRIENLQVRPFDDDFDFESSSSFTQIDNLVFGKPQIDPFDIGEIVEIKFVNKEDLGYRHTFTLSDFLDEQDGLAAIETGGILSAAGVGHRVRSQLGEAGVYEYKIDGFNVVFGKPEAETIKIGILAGPDALGEDTSDAAELVLARLIHDGVSGGLADVA